MIGILNAYILDMDPGSYQKEYSNIALEYFRSIFPDEKLKTYLVAQNQLPKSINECDGWIITGSPASAYEDKVWIKNLIKFAQDSHFHKKKLLGICFGHQLIAHALGGEIINFDQGWGVGIREFEVLKNTTWMKPALSKDCSMIFSHQDQVIKLPLNAEHLATDPFCKFQMYSIDNHIFSMQGHPEFTREYAKQRYDTRVDKIGEGKYQEAIHSLAEKTHELVVGDWIKNFFNPVCSEDLGSE